MKKIFFFSVLCLLISAVAYAQQEENENGVYEVYQKIALKSEITSVQPMTGIVFFTKNPEKATDAISLEFSYCLYSDVVKEKGVYDWSAFEKMLDQIASRKHQAVIRFRYVYVGDAQSAVPKYIREFPDYEETVALSEGRETCFPDWRHPELRRFHLEFYREFAKRYDKDKRLAFLQVGFGLWAEYHLYQGPLEIGRTFPSKEFQTEFLLEMDKNFKNTPWSISKDAAAPVYTPFSENPELRNLKFGLFDDSFMHETHWKYNTSCWFFFGRNRYKESPMGGEFGYYTKYDQVHVLDYPDGIHGYNFETEARNFHITYINGNNQNEYQSLDRIKQASMACGYRYTILDFRADEKKSFVLVKNTGVAPIYRDAFVTVNGLRAKESLIDLQPGEESWYEIQSGGTNPALSIECDHLLEGQKIEFEADI